MQPTKRLFLGIPIPLVEIEAITAFQEKHVNLKGLSWVPARNLHITTYFLGEVEIEQLENLQELLRVGLKKIKPFELNFHSFCFAPRPTNPRMIWAKYHKHPEFKATVQQIDRLYQQIHPNQKNRKSPIPHITVARLKKFYRFEAVNMDLPFPDTPLLVQSLVLWESILKPQGAVYYELERFEL